MAGIKITLYILASILLSYLVINHAFVTREQFYPVIIYLVTNKPSILVLGNMAFVTVILFAWFIKTIFLGSLKPTEVEVCTWKKYRHLMLSHLKNINSNDDYYYSLICPYLHSV